MPRRRRIKLPPRIALPAAELERRMMATLRGLKECAKLKGVRFVHVESRTGSPIHCRSASRRLVDERSLPPLPRCGRNLTSSSPVRTVSSASRRTSSGGANYFQVERSAVIRSISA
jgi:hypothetical protein